MTVKTDVKVVGAKEALKALNRLDPNLRKQFVQDVRQVAEPALEAGRQAYKFVPLSGMNRKWAGPAVGGRAVFPLTIAKAQRGIQVKVDTSRRATSTLYIQQKDPGWAIFETAGRKNPNRLDDSLGDTPRPATTRLFGKAITRARDKIQREVEAIVLKVVNDMNTRLN
jgi:hypothetical protein